VPASQRGRFIVLNFDNADIETVVHAASEIVGFNYVLGPGVTGKKVTVTGTVMARNGMKAIDVEKFEPMAANTK